MEEIQPIRRDSMTTRFDEVVLDVCEVVWLIADEENCVDKYTSTIHYVLATMFRRPVMRMIGFSCAGSKMSLEKPCVVK